MGTLTPKGPSRPALSLTPSSRSAFGSCSLSFASRRDAVKNPDLPDSISHQYCDEVWRVPHRPWRRGPSRPRRRPRAPYRRWRRAVWEWRPATSCRRAWNRRRRACAAILIGQHPFGERDWFRLRPRYAQGQHGGDTLGRIGVGEAVVQGIVGVIRNLRGKGAGGESEQGKGAHMFKHFNTRSLDAGGCAGEAGVSRPASHRWSG